MKTKVVIIVFLLAIIVGFVVYNIFFGYYSVKNEQGEDENIFVYKTKNVQASDIVAYRYPLQYDTKLRERRVLLGRVVACPGSLLQIANGDLYINANSVDEDEIKIVRCRLSLDTAYVDLEQLLEQYEVKIDNIFNDGKACDFFAKISQVEKIQSDTKSFAVCRIIVERSDWKDTEVFPTSAFYAWNKDNFGPIYLPIAGDTIILTPRQAPMYKNIISLFEGNDFEADTYHVKINQQETNSYITTENYYFILNDNRANINDCRSYGPISDKYIIGKVLLD